MALDNPATNGQADASAGIFLLCVQAAENLKDPLVVVRVDADAVVVHGDRPLFAVLLCRNVYAGWLFAVILQSVANQVLQQVRQLRRVTLDGRQRVARYRSACLLNLSPKHLHHVVTDMPQLRPFEGRGSTVTVPANSIGSANCPTSVILLLSAIRRRSMFCLEYSVRSQMSLLLPTGTFVEDSVFG